MSLRLRLRSDWAVSPLSRRLLACLVAVTDWELAVGRLRYIYSDLGTVGIFLIVQRSTALPSTTNILWCLQRQITINNTKPTLLLSTITSNNPNNTNTNFAMAPSNNNKMWKKRYLIPLWVVQLIVLGIYFVLAIVGMSAAEDLDDYLDSPGYNRSEYSDQVVYVPSSSPAVPTYFTPVKITPTNGKKTTAQSTAQPSA